MRIMIMTTPTIEIPAYLLDTTQHLNNRLNEYLESINAPAIGLHNDPINRSHDFVEFEKWLKTVDIDILDDLIEQFGLIPLIFSIAGTDVTYSILLQDSKSIVLDGYVRYIDSALIRTTGGRALKFYSSVRLDVRKGELIKANNENVGARTKVKVVKNKVAPPFKTAEFDLMYGEGISKAGTLIDIGTNMEIINKSGAWYSYNGERMGQGKEAAKQYLLDNPQIADEIDRIIRDTLAVGTEEIDVIGEEVTEEV